MHNIFVKAIELIASHDPELISIVQITLKMCFSSSLAALLLGVPFGAFLALTRFPGRRAIIVLNRTLMSMPPVVCGLICYILFSGVGSLRALELLYTVTGMVIAQVILITPIVAANTETFLSGIVPDLRETTKGLGLGFTKTLGLTILESKYQIVSTYLVGFARSIAEVGAVSMVGGAIVYKTNVMTTAIMNYTSRGNFSKAMAIGIILMTMSLIVNIIVHLLSERVVDDR